MSSPTSNECAEKCSEYLSSLKSLLELAGENVFKIRAFDKAAQTILEVEGIEKRAMEGTLTEVSGIGKGIAQVLTEYLKTGTCELEGQLKKDLPLGLIELTQVPGLGPKKARVIIESLGITSWMELEYACQENRLLTLPGFGAAAQTKILKAVQFLKSTQGKKLLDEAMAESRLVQECVATFGDQVLRHSEVGAIRRRDEVITSLEYLVELSSKDHAAPAKVNALSKKIIEACKNKGVTLEVRLSFSSGDFGYRQLELTASGEFWTALKSELKMAGVDLDEASQFLGQSESELLAIFLKKLGAKSQTIAPECMSDARSLAAARSGELEQLVGWDSLQGGFHLHTVASDGIHTLEQMVETAAGLGWKYIGVSDHSQSAFYAGGLTLQKLKEQKSEVARVQKIFPQIKIYWGIESDILQDGSLDYSDEVLSHFDFVIASVHQRFKADKEQMTARLIKAINNPYTTMIGHLSGRLLLSREPYAFDEEAVFKAAGKARVIIEFNASPHRLDVDWRLGASLKKHNVMVSINPDAHDRKRLSDVTYGIAMARKALVPASQVLNTQNRAGIDQWLQNKK